VDSSAVTPRLAIIIGSSSPIKDRFFGLCSRKRDLSSQKDSGSGEFQTKPLSPANSRRNHHRVRRFQAKAPKASRHPKVIHGHFHSCSGSPVHSFCQTKITHWRKTFVHHSSSDSLPFSRIHHPAMGNGVSSRPAESPIPIKRDVSATGGNLSSEDEVPTSVSSGAKQINGKSSLWKRKTSSLLH